MVVNFTPHVILSDDHSHARNNILSRRDPGRGERPSSEVRMGVQGAAPPAGGFKGSPPEFKNTPGGWVESTAPRLSAEAGNGSA